MAVSNHRPINVLSIDGGSNGLPGLYLLEEIFSRLSYDLKSEDELRPSEYFNIIGGSGSGALIGLLLGRLKMTITHAIEAYIKLVPILSLPPANDEKARKANSALFEQTFHEILRDAGLDVDTPLNDESGPKILAFTLNSVSMSTPYILRSYRSRTSGTATCTVLQAACACVASSDRFTGVTIGAGLRQVTLVDASMGCANPTSELLREAREVFGGKVGVATIVSIGTEAKIIHSSSNGVVSHEVELLRRTNSDCKRIHEEMQTRLGGSGVYHRLKPAIEPGLSQKEVFAHVCDYVQEMAGSTVVDAIVKNMQSLVAGPSLQDTISVTTVEVTLKPRPSLARNFLGREDILNAMRQTHLNARPTDISGPSITVLTGLGGSGKTQIALKFALEYKRRHPQEEVYFVDGNKETTLKTDLEIILRSQGANHRSITHEDALMWLATKSKEWLLIIDNVDDPNLKLSSLIPKCSHGHVIITTRDATRRILAPDSTHIVEGLSTSDAVTLLLKSSGHGSNPTDERYAKAIVDELGHLPLALSHAAAYISTHHCLSTFLSTYRQSRAQLLQSSPDLLQGYPHSVAATIQMSLDRLPPNTRDLLRILAHLDARSIAYAVLAKAAERHFRHTKWTNKDDLQPETTEQANALIKIFCPSQQWVPAKFDEMVSTCLQYSLLRVATQNEERFYSMHVLVQDYLQHDTDQVQGHTPAGLVTRLLGSAITVSGGYYDHFAYYRLLFPHIRIVDLKKVVEPGDHYGFGRVLQEAGDGEMAIAHLERCVDQWKRWKGEESRNTLAAMVGLGGCYKDVGREKETLELSETILKNYRRLRGDDHRDTLTAMNNLAGSYSAVGREQEALELRETVLEKRKGLLGDDHRDTVRAMNNLAYSYSATGREREALELREMVLEKYRRLLGDDHRDTIQAMGNVAFSYSIVGRQQEALPIQQLVLAKFTNSIGWEHDHTLLVMRHLSTIYQKLGMVTELDELLQNALPLHEKVLGVDHDNTKWLRAFQTWVQANSLNLEISMEAEDGQASDDAPSPAIQSDKKRKRVSNGSEGTRKRRK